MIIQNICIFYNKALFFYRLDDKEERDETDCGSNSGTAANSTNTGIKNNRIKLIVIY